MEYKASFDTLTKIITAGVVVLFVFIGQRSVKALSVVEGDTTTILIHGGLLIFLVLTFIVCYLFSTQKYLIDDHELVIKRPISERRILISDIVEVRPVRAGEMTGTIRTFGVGGLFGYYGKFYNRTFGSMTLYTTQRTNRILIRTTKGDKIIISPDDISLVDTLKSQMESKQ